MRSLNESACAALLRHVRWDEPASLASLAVLALIDVLVIAGNCLVIAAVLCSSKLRSVTNLFIVSLAVADLLVGVAVLPFSATREVFEIWIFGDVWCSVWLAVDVWMCTASILNLCAISLDRYVAVTRPVSYPSIMSRKRAKALIGGLWVLSFVICFPPLVGWKDKKPDEAELKDDWSPNPPCPWTCELTNDAGYVVYSALGSFYIPMFVMLFFYWRIYKAAVRTTKAINQGFRTTKGKGMGNRFDDNRLTLRIHRGRGSARPHGSPLSTASNHSTSTSLSASPERLRRHSSARRAHEKVKISVSYPSSEQICPVENSRSPSRSPSPSLYAVHYERDGRELTESRLRVRSAHHLSPGMYDEFDDKPRATRRMGKRNIKAQVKRFRMETKAAKTLGIIVGGFVFCWLPFFSVYVVRAFCGECVTPIVFSVLFWLGYCNSAINPLIYALFSKDFRFAFKRIICKCFCGGGGSRRESDGSARARAAHRPVHEHSLEDHDNTTSASTTNDRGATHSNLVICDATGKVVGRAKGPGTNHWIMGIEECAKRIISMLHAAKGDAGISREQPLDCLGLTLSGCEQESSNAELAARVREKDENSAHDIYVASDTAGSLFTGAPNGGMVLIAGTGSNALLRTADGEQHGCGGWGYLLGDEGAAYWIAHRAVKTVFDDVDGLRPSPHPTDNVWEVIKEHFGAENRADLLPHAYKHFDKSHFAGVTAKLAQLAKQGDALSLHLFAEAGAALAAHVAALAQRCKARSLRVVCVGSVWNSWPALKPGALNVLSNRGVKTELELVRLRVTSAMGAAWLAAKHINYNLPRDDSAYCEVFYTYRPEEHVNGKLQNGDVHGVKNGVDACGCVGPINWS